MELRELLSELRMNILHDRSHRESGAEDYLWSDETLIRYINEAQMQLARKGLVLRDARTPEVTIVQPVVGQQQYDLHPAVIAVISAKSDADNADMARAGHSALDTYQTPDTRFPDPAALNNLPPGKPLAFSTDEDLANTDMGSSGVVSLRLYPAPTTDHLDPIRLRVVRTPINPLTMEDLRAIPEVPTQHHLEMLDWAAYLALRIADVDAGMPSRAQDFRDAFMAMVVSAKREAMRKMFVPKPWAFGRGGFSWER